LEAEGFVASAQPIGASLVGANPRAWRWKSSRGAGWLGVHTRLAKAAQPCGLAPIAARGEGWQWAVRLQLLTVRKCSTRRL
jgi:hypothetical protein